ncbi:WecB/TagA/CpsF family glycosyltransferase [Modestobacter sp. VKM Ac-2978]|uniref:WecB/TagA/CpsF family glycosyltransferase n=1 Tax=Modestobacter sp. VKM Ac-2978 TaxID=3004132 RepID=UPI0022A9FDDC|nr:WecB/TagA/CpsF family glycosyltransferase [Modestobacter sp. VKM Ac-2978]MCZ2846982.1 WecB/TagA/CpsF family glycosyltransferase [Modestobacter sp. VKM Ac-2978]
MSAAADDFALAPTGAIGRAADRLVSVPALDTVIAPEQLPAAALAKTLLTSLALPTGGVVTWLNHYTALQSLQAGTPIEEFDYLGLDGILLCRLVRSGAERTSADLVLPLLLEAAAPLRVALIGSTPGTLAQVAARIEAEYGHNVVLVRDGYTGLPAPEELRRQLLAARAQVAIVGLGAPLQDRYALALRSPRMLVATCGGWLDQFAGGTYYPAWAYPLKLNWLVRLAREPRRLWRRYSVDAVRALRARRRLTDYVVHRGHVPLAATTSGTAASSADAPAA